MATSMAMAVAEARSPVRVMRLVVSFIVRFWEVWLGLDIDE